MFGRTRTINLIIQFVYYKEFILTLTNHNGIRSFQDIQIQQDISITNNSQPFMHAKIHTTTSDLK